MSSYCELSEFSSNRWVKARKEYKCCECGVLINKGEFHGVFSGKWDGRVEFYRQHLECEDACRYIRDELQDGDCICFGELFEVANEYYTDKGFRQILARIKWRQKKKRKLNWLPKYTYEPKDLKLSRERGYS